jgi:hypothetical protein
MSIESVPFERTTPLVDAIWKRHPAAPSQERELELLRLARNLERCRNAAYVFINGMTNMPLGDRLAKRKALLKQLRECSGDKQP